MVGRRTAGGYTASTVKPDVAMIKAFREQTGSPIVLDLVDVKKALVETECDMTTAIARLRTKGMASAAKKRPVAKLPRWPHCTGDEQRRPRSSCKLVEHHAPNLKVPYHYANMVRL